MSGLERTTRGSRRVLGVIAVLLVVVVAVAALANRRTGEVSYAAGTPEATAQAFMRALADDRRGDALDLVDDQLRARCESTPQMPGYPSHISRVVLVDRRVAGDTATIEVKVTQAFGGGMFDTEESSMRETLQLVRTELGWRISAATWTLNC